MRVELFRGGVAEGGVLLFEEEAFRRGSTRAVMHTCSIAWPSQVSFTWMLPAVASNAACMSQNLNRDGCVTVITYRVYSILLARSDNI